MRSVIRYLALAAAVASGVYGIVVKRQSGYVADRVVQVSSEDAAMSVAIKKARESLPKFFETLSHPRPGDDGFAVKIHYLVGTQGGGEHIWANEVERHGDEVSATINNKPERIPDLKMGQRVTVPIDRITDWLFIRGGMIQGGQTIRALLPFMSKPEADALRPQLAPE